MRLEKLKGEEMRLSLWLLDVKDGVEPVGTVTLQLHRIERCQEEYSPCNATLSNNTVAYDTTGVNARKMQRLKSANINNEACFILMIPRLSPEPLAAGSR